MPVADGGEGTMEVLLLALGGETAAARVSGPLGEPSTPGSRCWSTAARRSSRSRRPAG